MIGYLKGNLISFSDGVIVLENNGIGFEINCSSEAYAKLISEGGGEVFVYTSVKDDGITLFGFISREEKEVFLKLISVSGVGPKMGITVLAGLNSQRLAQVIAQGDVKTLSSVKGLGKKTAERLVMELKDKFSVCADDSMVTEQIAVEDTEEEKDAVTALCGLGFSKSESQIAVREAKKNGAKTVTQLIGYAIKNIR